MKKDRNSFFSEASYMNTNIPNNMNGPFSAAYANQGFYQGPMNIPLNYNTNNNGMPQVSDYSDIEARLSKLERLINRLDARLNKLETNSFYTTEDIDNTTNVYMV